jgi:lycopene elongase/hydratase (dihydrobisanhydrobacterioruberin-forming)
MNNVVALAIKISRPRFWGYLAGPYLIGYVIGIQQQTDLLNPLFFIHLIYFILVANVLVYGVNDLFDMDTDQKNPKKESHEHKLQMNEKKILQRLFLASLFISGFMLLLQPDLTAVLLFVAFIVLATLYSMEPIRFKARPVVDFASNIHYAIPGFLAYYQITGQLPILGAVIAAFCWTGAMHLFSAVPDITPDKKAGLKTTAVVLGLKKSLILTIFLWLITALIALNFGQLFPWSLLAFIYPAIPLWVLFNSKQIDNVYWKFPYVTMTLGAILFFIFFLSKPLS